MNRRIKVILALYAIIALAYTYELVRPRHGWEKKAFIEQASRMRELRDAPNHLTNWPPQLGQAFPQVKLFDHTGNDFSINMLAGKPILVEFVAMTCAACQAWSGAHERGVFEDLAAQTDLESIEKYFPQCTDGLKLSDGTIHFVQLVVYNTNLDPPVASDLQSWRKHFGFDRHENFHTVSGGAPLASGATFRMVPGFMLLDKNLIVRYAMLGPGSDKPHNLYTEILPAIRQLSTSSS